MQSNKFENLATRIFVALIGIPLIIWLIMLGGYYFFLLIGIISSLSLFEFYRLSEAKGARPLKTLGIIAGILINGVFIYERFQVVIYKYCLTKFGLHLSIYSQYQLLTVIIIKFLLIVLFIELFRKKGSPIVNIGTTLSGVLIISLSFSTLIFLRELFPAGFPFTRFYPTPFLNGEQLAQIDRWGGYTIISVIVSIWMCDTAAYFGGSKYGRHLLFERVSPKKTIEGAVFGFFFAVITMLVAKILVLEYVSFFHSIIIGALIGIFGQIGDLIESRFKRDAEVKDSSSLIPGHGGVYDRFDSLVYISPIVYLYISFVVLS